MSLESWIKDIGYYNESISCGRTRALLFGDTGVGKTRLAGTFPHPFFLDSDKGGKTLEGMRIPYLPLERTGRVFDTVMEVLRNYQAGKPPFDTLKVETFVFDSLTSLADMLMVEAMRTVGKVAVDANREKPSWDHYAVIQARLKTIIKFAQDLVANVVATCGTKLEKDDVRGTFVGKPNIIGGYRDLVSYDFDDVVYMTCEGTQTQRKYLAYTGKISYYEAKTRSGLDFKYENPSYQSMYGGKKPNDPNLAVTHIGPSDQLILTPSPTEGIPLKEQSE